MDDVLKNSHSTI